MYKELFTIPVFAAIVLLVVHSWVHRGRRATLVFWGLGYLAAFARELAYQNLFPTYRFTGAALQILNVPVTIPMGWLFEAYISLHVAQVLMGVDLATLVPGDRRITPADYGRRVVPVLGLAAAVTGTISNAIEAAGLSMGWWIPKNGDPTEYLLPGWKSGHMFISGHMLTVFWLLTLLAYLTWKPLRLGRSLAFVALTLALTVVLEMPDRIAPAEGAFPWFGVAAGAVVVGMLVLLAFSRPLMLFMAVFVAGLTSDGIASLLSSAFGGDNLTRWRLCIVCANIVPLAYGLYLLRGRTRTPPERPVA